MKYPIYKPYLTENAKKYVMDCIESTWISSRGDYVNKFENAIAKECNIKYATSVFNGTVALHLALLTLGIGPGDEVIIPNFTYIATANTVVHVGAKPIFADVNSEDWNIDLKNIKKVYNNKVKAIIIVDIYGTQSKELEAIYKFAKDKGIFLIQDSAESLGSKINDKKIGHYADIATISFFGNKTITTGEGGMLITNSEEIFKKAQILKNQGNSPTTRYYHDILGYNFRMTNIQAAIGCSQIEVIEDILNKKNEIYNWYKKYLGDKVKFQDIPDNSKSSYWLISVLVENRDKIEDYLSKHGIETRPFFMPISSMPFYEEADTPITHSISRKGICLPSYPELCEADVEFICKKIIESDGI